MHRTGNLAMISQGSSPARHKRPKTQPETGRASWPSETRSRRRPKSLTRDQTHRPVERTKHTLELMAAAQDMTGCRNDAVRALPARQAGILFDPVNREFGGASENGKDGAVFQKIDRVVPPFTRCDLTAVETENAVKLAPAKSNFACGGGRAHLAPAPRARLDFANGHAAPPLPKPPSWKLHYTFMIAPDRCGGKSLSAPTERLLAGFFHR